MYLYSREPHEPQRSACSCACEPKPYKPQPPAVKVKLPRLSSPIPYDCSDPHSLARVSNMQLHDTAFGQTLRVFFWRQTVCTYRTGFGMASRPAAGRGQGGGSSFRCVQEASGPRRLKELDWTVWAVRWLKQSDTTSIPASDSSNDNVSNATIHDQANSSFVTWYGEPDPENPQNWSSRRKAFVAGLICGLHIHRLPRIRHLHASIMGVMQQFQVSYAAANLGLALFRIRM